MSELDNRTDPGGDSASNLRAIFEILSYILVDAQHDNYKELAERIEFALNCAEKQIKQESQNLNSGGNFADYGESTGSLSTRENEETLI
ncbi:MAG: hypothetical protein V7723_06705 [Sneathiella sp.]|uniref:hypothetical protein n=1 Tax=Sneathiella sp. TaxID=1964365 RepID=UPI003001A26B